MPSDVKVVSAVLGRSLSANGSPRFYFGWILYFILSIGIIGGLFAYGISIPLLILGNLYRPLWKLGGRVMVAGVSFLLKCQPWLKATVQIELPKAPYVTISNHRSHLDMFFLLAHVPNIRVVAKKTLFYVPFLAIMMRVMKMIPVKKGDMSSYLASLETCKKAVEHGDPVHIFPEMSRCSFGFQGVQALHLAPFKTLMEMGIPVIPIVFKNTDRVWAKGNLGLSYREPVIVRSLPALFPSDFQTAEAFRVQAWERINEALRD